MTVTFGESERGKPARYDLEDFACADAVELQRKLEAARAALRDIESVALSIDEAKLARMALDGLVASE